MPVFLLLVMLLICPALAEGRFEGDIKAIEARPPVAQGGTVFVGSSTFTIWGKGLEQEFAEYGAVNRGFGGSTLRDIVEYAPRIIVPLKPRAVVVYAGTNDLSEGHTPAEVSEDFRRLVTLVRASQPKAKVAFVSLSLPPSRVHLAEKFTETNRLIRQYVDSTPGLYFIDVSRELLDDDGQPRAEFFREDRLHMTQSGYDRWVPMMHKALKAMGE